MAGYRGTFVISWSQTEVDGLFGAPIGAIERGVCWRWRGTPVRIDGPNDVLVLSGHEGERELRARAARAARKIVGSALPVQGFDPLSDPDSPVFERYFVVTDGLRSFPVTLIDMPDIAQPLLLFLGALPPEETDLWVVQCVEKRGGAPAPTEGRSPAVICFAHDTRLDTTDGQRPIQHLRPGDRVLTRDDGPQEILWVGYRRISGARMHAMPDLRPIRVRAGALGRERPEPDLIVSPEHRLLLRGQVARALFNTNEVLVAAGDLVNDQTIFRDHACREVRYFHLMLKRHQVVWANGIEAESFHPAQTSLEAVAPDQRAGLIEVMPAIGRNPGSYGPAARRMLSRPEAAILLHEARRRH